MKGKKWFMAVPAEEEDTERAVCLSGWGDLSVSASCCDPAPPLWYLSIISLSVCRFVSLSLCLSP